MSDQVADDDGNDAVETLQQLRAEAEALDRLLATQGCEPPSPMLTATVLAAIPRRRRRIPAWAAWTSVPLAAAAALLLWVRAPSPETPQLASVAAWPTGEYRLESDVLLETLSVDYFSTVPSVGCDDSWLACPPDEPTEPYSQSVESGRRTA